VARRWPDAAPPGARWGDDAVRDRATSTAERMVNAGAHAHRKQADQADKVAAEHEQAVARRERQRESDIWMDTSNAHNREILVAKAERERATIAAGRALRSRFRTLTIRLKTPKDSRAHHLGQVHQRGHRTASAKALRARKASPATPHPMMERRGTSQCVKGRGGTRCARVLARLRRPLTHLARGRPRSKKPARRGGTIVS
jgi:hypothetical protein